MAGILSVPRLLPELLFYREAPSEECEEFKHRRHDADLCPSVERQVRALLDSFLKYSAVAYDVQGFQDRGTDVLLRYLVENAEGEQWRFISFQVKSYHDLRTDRYFLKNLRAQYFDARAEYSPQLEHYFILAATTYDKTERRKLRWIKKTFARIENATVVDPGYVLTFLRMSRARVNLVVEALLREDDIVFERARGLIEEMAPTRAALVVALCERAVRAPGPALALNELCEDPFLEDMYGHLPDYETRDYELLEERIEWEARCEDEPFPDEEEGPVDRRRGLRERVSEDLEGLVGDLVELDGEDRYLVDPRAYDPMLALLYDAAVRFDYSGSQLSEYVFSSLGLLESYGLAYPESFERDAVGG